MFLIAVQLLGKCHNKFMNKLQTLVFHQPILSISVRSVTGLYPIFPIRNLQILPRWEMVDAVAAVERLGLDYKPSTYLQVRGEQGNRINGDLILYGNGVFRSLR